MSKSEEKITTVADLYPDLTADEQRAAVENLRRYLNVVKLIYEYVAANDQKILTELRKRARLRKRREIGLI
jgi:orotidine-5'-phosphate decarboxylase